MKGQESISCCLLAFVTWRFPILVTGSMARRVPRPRLQFGDDCLRCHDGTVELTHYQLQVSARQGNALGPGHHAVEEVEPNRRQLIDECAHLSVRVGISARFTIRSRRRPDGSV